MLSAMAFRFTITDYSGQSNDHKDGDWYEFSPGGITVCTMRIPKETPSNTQHMLGHSSLRISHLARPQRVGRSGDSTARLRVSATERARISSLT